MISNRHGLKTENTNKGHPVELISQSIKSLKFKKNSAFASETDLSER